VVVFSGADPTRAVRDGSRRAGWALLALSLVGAFGLTALPAPYVISQPGPTYDTLGSVTVDDQDIALIEVRDQPDYPEFAEIRLTTVTRLGSPENLPTWLDVISAWLSPQRSVTPVDVAFPPGVSYEETREAAAVEMENSQQEAIAAAFTYLDIPYDSFLDVAATLEGGPSEGVILEGDIILSAAGEIVGEVTRLREIIAENGVQQPLDLIVERDGVERDLQVIPRMSEGPEPFPAIGVLVSGQYEFPIDISIQLQNVGGPSAGLAFALGVVERLTEEVVADSFVIAATGSISASGNVGPIGGVAQKAYGAAESGAEWFLIPAENCDAVVSTQIRGLTIVPVRTLDDAMGVLESIHLGEELPSCQNLSALPSDESQGEDAPGL
jgi:PDZ domain-containing protein